MSRCEDLTGRKFNHLTVISRYGVSNSGKATWTCVCDCGAETVVVAGSLKSGNTKSCGCGIFFHSPVALDMTGRRFGRWTVVERDGRSASSGAVMWRCVCDCGSESSIEGSTLRGGFSQSCGCAGAERLVNRFVEYRQSDAGKLAEVSGEYRKYAQNASRRGLEFDLQMDDFRALCFDNCHYCGTAPSRKNKSNKKNDSGLRWNGIDRMDPKIGYVVENCVPACATCNFAKGSMGYEEFKSWIRSVYDRSKIWGDGLTLSPSEAAAYIGATISERAA